MTKKQTITIHDKPPSSEFIWIDIKDYLPYRKVIVYVQNGKKKYRAQLVEDQWVAEGYGKEEADIILHKVTHWAQDPWSSVKIPMEDLAAFCERAEKYKDQMQPKKFNPKLPPFLQLAESEIL